MPGQLHVSGASVPGIPFVFIGRNKDLTWTFARTSGTSAERVFVDDAQSGEQLDAPKVRDEVIRVRVSDAVVMVVEETALGPLVQEQLAAQVRGVLEARPWGWNRVALHADVLTERMSIDFLRAINMAQDVEALSAGAKMLTAAPLSFIYAARSGEIGVVISGR